MPRLFCWPWASVCNRLSALRIDLSSPACNCEGRAFDRCRIAATVLRSLNGSIRACAFNAVLETYGFDSSQRLASWISLESAMVKRTRKIAKEIEQDFAHFVDIVVPPGGPKLAAMYDFHARHRISPKRGRGRRDHTGGAIRWCFADRWLADAFAQEFARK
jgi:hypothetical protein